MPDPEYFDLERPDEQTVPIVVDVPHAGEWIPDAILNDISVSERVLRRDLDLYVDEFWRDAPEQGATLLRSNVSRYVVDLNRAADDVTGEAVEGGESKYRPGYYRDRGVVWHTTTTGESVLDAPLSKQDFKQRLDTFYYPYHERLEAELERIRDEFGYCILVDGHSMPSQGRSRHSDTGQRRPDIVPGDIDGAACDTTIRWTIEEHFRERGYSVKSNNPYKGGWITRHYGNPDDDIHAIQIEVNRDLYMHEDNFDKKPDGLATLRRDCTDLLDALAPLDL